uniref:Uncharacterized protein n=1 Tax=Noctiluca scintillans TaxID=2966 RepID=A0A7S1FCS9_NOCSC|mmetsp:Transcript_53717/g.143704  ORF Transcript_53717/g.143704 Transcript_53717/m.143704 type:complete len:538 (+) Transcript_53717:38-1651(+)
MLRTLLVWLSVFPSTSGARVDHAIDLEVDAHERLDTFCGMTSVPSEASDTCQKGDVCCCMVNGSAYLDGCKSPDQCLLDGGECAESLWYPTLASLQAEYRRRVNALGNYGEEPGPDLETADMLSIGGACARPACLTDTTYALCARNRGVVGQWGAILALSVGRREELRAIADKLRVWHWSSHYPASPYRSSVKRFSTYAISPQLKMSPNHCSQDGEAAGSGCCLWNSGKQWGMLISKLNLAKDCSFGRKQCFNLERSRQRFTFTITAPQNSEDLEFRCAQMESKFLNGIKGAEQIYDLKSKHAFLNQFKDWVLYAGEMWFQPKFDKLSDEVKKGGDVRLDDVMVVIDNNSGTMAPGGDSKTRLGVQLLMSMALGVGLDQVQVCQCPFSMKKGMLTWKAAGDACPHNPVFYKGVPVPEGSEAQAMKTQWLETMMSPPWSKNVLLLLKYIQGGRPARRIPGYKEAQNEARTFAIPCDMYEDGTLGANAFCWSGCREPCSATDKLKDDYVFQDTGIHVGGGVVYARNCHVGSQRLCRTVG